jgi:hypothetical protein
VRNTISAVSSALIFVMGVTSAFAATASVAPTASAHLLGQGEAVNIGLVTAKVASTGVKQAKQGNAEVQKGGNAKPRLIKDRAIKHRVIEPRLVKHGVAKPATKPDTKVSQVVGPVK